MSAPDLMLVTAVTRAVQDALEADATERVRAGKPPLARSGQEALAYKVLSAELQRHDAERLGSGGARLTPEMEQSVVDRVLALSVGLVYGWGRTGFGALDPENAMRAVIPAVTLMILGMQAAAGALFAAALNLCWSPVEMLLGRNG